MADPKYANLPGIAHDQPDVYETHDLPESEQHLDDDASGGGGGGGTDCVETLHISANEAMGRFKGKQLDASDIDFSDRIRGPRGRRGYVAWSGELELLNRAGGGGGGSGEESETPLQRYNRLNCEVNELWDEINALKKQAADEEAAGKKGGDGGGNLNAVAAKVGTLQDELSKMNLEETLGAELVKNLQDPHGSANAKLMAHLDQVKLSRSKSGQAKTPSAGAAGDKNVTYELMMKPDTAKLESEERVARFDRRLEALEKALGADQDAMSSLCLETNSKSVSGALSVLLSRTSLLQPSHLDHVEGRLAVLVQKMNEVAEKKAALDDQEKQTKLNELYDLVQKCDGMAAALPEIVDRLETLQGLHQQALEFSTALAQMEAAQQKLAANLSSNQTLLKETQKKFDQNAESLTGNLKAMDDRMKKLGK